MHWLLETARSYLHLYGYWAVLFALLGENAGLPLPGETILILASFAAYHGHTHHLKIHWIILIGICACTLGDNVGYWIGRRGGRPLLDRYKNLFRIHDEVIRSGEEFLQRRGFFAIFLARFIAGMRIVAGPLAGVLRMEWKRFLIANFAGAVVWVTAISSAGYFFGSQYRTFARILKQTEAVVLVALLVLALYLLRRKKIAYRNGKQDVPADEPAAPESRKIKV